MNFHLRIKDGHSYYNDRPCYYFINSSKQDSIEQVQSLSPVCIYGDNFKEVKKNIRTEYKKEENPRLEMTGALKKRFTLIEQKINELIMPGESINRVYFHFNNAMSKPMVIVCLGVHTGAMTGIEQGRVIVSGVDTIIEQDHFVHGNRCDYYAGFWNYHQSKNDKHFINVDCTRRQDEKPLAYRGK